MRPCSDDCGRYVKHYAEECFPIAPWDPPGLPPRVLNERCQTHGPGREFSTLCAYRDDDPKRCSHCHRLLANDTDHRFCRRVREDAA